MEIIIWNFDNGIFQGLLLLSSLWDFFRFFFSFDGDEFYSLNRTSFLHDGWMRFTWTARVGIYAEVSRSKRIYIWIIYLTWRTGGLDFPVWYRDVSLVSFEVSWILSKYCFYGLNMKIFCYATVRSFKR